MPSNFITLEEQGAYAPGRIIQDSVNNFLANQIRRSEEDRRRREFLTSQAVRDAEAAPIIDQDAVAAHVAAAQAAAKLKRDNAQFVGGLEGFPRLAASAGILPKASNVQTNFDPTDGSTVTTEADGFYGPDNIFTPYGGKSARGAPPISTVTSIKPPDPNTPATPGLAVVQTKDVARGRDGKEIVLNTTEKPQRVTPPHGDAALLAAAEEMGVDPDDLKTLVTNLLTKKAQPAGARGGTPESIQAALDKYKAQLEGADDDEKPAIQAAIDNLQARMTALGRQYAPKPAKKSLAEKLGLDAADSSDTGTAKSSGTPAAKATPYVKGKVYRDAKNNRAIWDGEKFVDVPAGQ